MDLSYATKPVFGGEHQRIYKEVRVDYLVSDHENLSNHPIYAVKDELGSSIFHISDKTTEASVRKTYICKREKYKKTSLENVL